MHELLVCSPPFSHPPLGIIFQTSCSGRRAGKGGRQIDSARDSQSDRECATLGSLAYATSQSAAALTDARGRSQQQSREGSKRERERERVEGKERRESRNILYISVQP